MTIQINANTIITAAAVLAAIISIFAAIFACYRWYLKQGENDKKHDEEIQKLKKESDEQIKALAEKHDKEVERLEKAHSDTRRRIGRENTLICYALSACLDGLQQLGANHSVPTAKDKLDKYLNQQAHGQLD